MTASRPLKSILFLFAAVLVFYVVAYLAIEHRRTRNGPWSVAFSGNPGQGVLLRIDHRALGITNVQLRFETAPLATNLPESTVRFERPRKVPYALPYGECIFMDTTFQPGTVVMQVAGHEVQLIPRVLTINNVESPWKSGEVLTLREPPATNSVSEGRTAR